MLTFHYVPYTLIENLTSAKRVNLLISMVKTNDVILLEGKLKPKEETALIKKTMEQVSKEFHRRPQRSVSRRLPRRRAYPRERGGSGRRRAPRRSASGSGR